MFFTGVRFKTNHQVFVSNHGIFKFGIFLPFVITIELIADVLAFNSIGIASDVIILGIGII
jgi:hypothetical protein